MRGFRGFCTAQVVYRLGFAALILGPATLSSCSCGQEGGGFIPCATDPECPAPLTCSEDEGVCVDPRVGDGGVPYACNPPLPGCECESGDPVIACIPPESDPTLVGTCKEGQSMCVDGRYGACTLTADRTCEQVAVASGGFDLTPENSDQVVLGPEGELVLDPEVEQVEFGFLWVANTGENTVSKVDIETGHEVARYASVRDSASLGVDAVPVGGFNGSTDNCGNCPSRTAIDYNGDAFVANRAFGGQATVTKYGNESMGCIDRDGNGVIDTSADVDGDGRIAVDDPGEFLGEDDECILWTKPVGEPGEIARALAIDAGGPDGENGNVWVGLFNGRRVVALSGDTGDPILDAGGVPVSVSLSDGAGSIRPYGAAVDGGGNIWLTGIEEGSTVYIAKVNAYTYQLLGLYAVPDDDDGCSLNYGITIDPAQRIWVGGWQCHDVKGFDPATGNWYRVDRDDESNTRGVAVDIAGNVWVAYDGGRVGRFRIDDVIAMGDNAPGTMFDLPPLPAPWDGGIDNTIGVGIDKNGACWAVSRNDDLEVGAATRIKPDGTMESFPVGLNPYTYSDFTGFGLLTVVRPNGWWRGTIEGCAKSNTPSDWTMLEWGEIEPPGTAVRMRLRVADTMAGLATAPWYGPWDNSPVDLDAAGVPTAYYMEVEVQLTTTDATQSPAFTGFTVHFDCPDVDPVP